MEFSCSLTECLIFNQRAAPAVCKLASQRNKRKVFLLVSQSLRTRTPIIAEFEQALSDMHAYTWSGIRAHTPREDVISAAEKARKLGVDMIVTIGGGSVTDAGKAVVLSLALGFQTEDDMTAYRTTGGVGSPDTFSLEADKVCLLVCVPTTLSGGEFTALAGVTDLRGKLKRKHGFQHSLLQPRVLVYDPQITLYTPEWLFLSTGMRAVDHAVEGICSTQASPYTTTLAIAGLGLLAQALRDIKHETTDLKARLNAQTGVAIISSIIGHVPFGASHGIGHVLGGTADVPHGITSCIMLPNVLEYNSGDPLLQPQLRQVADALGAPPNTSAAAMCHKLVRDLGLPCTLAEVGVKEEMHASIARFAMKDAWTQTNPRPVTLEAMMNILMAAQYGSGNFGTGSKSKL